MKDSKPSLFLYIIAGVAVIIAKIFDIEILILLFTPMVVPAIFYYYLQTKTKNTSLLFSVNLWMFFIADMLILIYPFSTYIILGVMSCGIISYLILIRFAILDNNNARFTVLNIIFLAVLAAILSYILFSIISLNNEYISNYFLIYLAYGLILIFLISISVFNYISESTNSFFHLCSMALCMLVSDLFYSIDKFVIALPILYHINIFAQIMSYFFMVRYFNSRRSGI